MNDFLHFFKRLSDTTDWPTTWQSGKWTSFEGWLYIVSDSILWVSFLIISFTATRFAGKTGKGIMAQLSPVIIWLSLAASMVLFMDAFMFWIPAYRVNSLMRACAAIISLVAVYKLHKHIPELMTLRPAADFESHNSTNAAAEEKIKALEAEIKKFTDGKVNEKNDIEPPIEVVNQLETRPENITNINNDEIAELHEAYNQLKAQNEHLEKKIAERTMQMEAISRELDAFSYAVSHDMRAPLRIINGYADVLHTDYSTALDIEGKRLLEIIRTNTMHMSSMIDALLSLARAGRKDLLVLPADMVSIVKSSISEQVNASGSNASFHLGDILSVNCDSVLIRNVWGNLISNAIKYSAHMEQPVIHIGSEKKEGKVMYFIKDNGVGFDMQYVHRLFGVFQRLHKSNSRSGAGTGLALVQRVILKHGGYVWAEGEENKGATFYFTLPENNN